MNPFSLTTALFVCSSSNKMCSWNTGTAQHWYRKAKDLAGIRVVGTCKEKVALLTYAQTSLANCNLNYSSWNCSKFGTQSVCNLKLFHHTFGSLCNLEPEPVHIWTKMTFHATFFSLAKVVPHLEHGTSWLFNRTACLAGLQQKISADFGSWRTQSIATGTSKEKVWNVKSI